MRVCGVYTVYISVCMLWMSLDLGEASDVRSLASSFYHVSRRRLSFISGPELPAQGPHAHRRPSKTPSKELLEAALSSPRGDDYHSQIIRNHREKYRSPSDSEKQFQQLVGSLSHFAPRKAIEGRCHCKSRHEYIYAYITYSIS